VDSECVVAVASNAEVVTDLPQVMHMLRLAQASGSVITDDVEE